MRRHDEARREDAVAGLADVGKVVLWAGTAVAVAATPLLVLVVMMMLAFGTSNDPAETGDRESEFIFASVMAVFILAPVLGWIARRLKRHVTALCLGALPLVLLLAFILARTLV